MHSPKPEKALVLATKNPGKIVELTAMLTELPYRIYALNDPELGILNLSEPQEDGEFFYENACIKAKYYADRLNLPCLADDSGLVIPALNGEPGVKSARFGGFPPGEDSGQRRSKLILEKMQGITERSCFFEATLVLAKPSTPRVLFYQGKVDGIIHDRLAGTLGFGYDNIFYLPQYGCTMAELEFNEKNKISHRAMAAKALQADWERILVFLGWHEDVKAVRAIRAVRDDLELP
ncbi:MAG: RdgB/HAM1 family non-canonical purine NTP pyrophosphatase [Deltaproteobacteria bacterium]|jgi:XTP/dITP diphosphohydrolase|nr:RdgB/HAM1 family non-canonical purine NTP pyrophosphatase [Deltaproteobacteria bacterium]